MMILEVIINYILILSIVSSLMMYFTSTIKGEYLESSILGIFKWMLKKIGYLIWSIAILPVKLLLISYLIIITLLLKLILIPLKTFLIYTRHTSRSLYIFDEIELYYYYTVDEALGFFSWLRRLTPRWLKQVSPLKIKPEPAKNYLFFWGYLIRYSLIIVYYTSLRLRRKAIIFVRYLVGIEFFYTFLAFSYGVVRLLTNEHSILWKILYQIRRQWFISITNWQIFHIWTGLRLKWADWKYSNNMEDWDQPRWLFQLPLTEEQLALFDRASKKKEPGKRYSLLVWLLTVLMGLVYQILGIIALFLLPAHIYIYIYRNQEVVSKKVEDFTGWLKETVIKATTLMFGRNWLIYIPHGMYILTFWIFKIAGQIIPALIWYSLLKLMETIWKMRVVILASIVFFFTYQEIDYARIIGAFTLKIVWFDWMFWVPFQFDFPVHTHGALLDVWHPGYFWNPRMVKPLLIDRHKVFIDQWLEVLIVDNILYIFELEILDYVKASWSILKEEGWQTYLYFARSYFFYDLEITYKRYKIFIIRSIVMTYHWWWLSYMQFNEWYTFCFIMTVIKKVVMIPLRLAAFYHWRFQENFPLIGMIPHFFIKAIATVIAACWKGVKFVLNLTWFYIKQTKDIRIDIIWIQSFIKAYYNFSIYKMISNHFFIEELSIWPACSWYIQIASSDALEQWNLVRTIAWKPFFINAIVIDYIKYICSLGNFQYLVSREIVAEAVSIVIRGLLQFEKFVDALFLNLQLPLDINEFYMEGDGEPTGLDYIFLDSDAGGIRNMFHLDWVEEPLLYFDSLDSWTYIEEFYARRDNNWNEKKFKPEYVLWYYAKFNIATSNDPDKWSDRMDWWFWVQKRYWWWTFYREYWFSEEDYIEPQITEGRLLNVVSLSWGQWYYLVMILLILFNRGFGELIKGKFKHEEYITNIEMAWRFFRKQKIGQLKDLYISPEDVEALGKVTKLKLEDQVKDELYPKLMDRVLSEVVANPGTCSSKLIKDLNSISSNVDMEHSVISRKYFDFLLKEKYSSFRRNTAVHGGDFTPFIAYFFRRNIWMKQVWQELDEDDYEAINENYREGLETYRNWWMENIYWLEEVNSKWFKGSLDSWILAKEYQSMEILRSKDVKGILDEQEIEYESEETEVTYLEYGIMFWFIYLPAMILYHAYSVESDTIRIFQPLANYFDYEMMIYINVVLSHLQSCHEFLWWSPDNFPAYKLSGTPDSDEDTTSAEYYKPDINSELDLYLFEGGYYDNTKYAALEKDLLYTTSDWVGPVEEIKIWEFAIRILTVICLVVITRIKTPDNTIEQTKVAISVWYKIKKIIKTQWYWR